MIIIFITFTHMFSHYVVVYYPLRCSSISMGFYCKARIFIFFTIHCCITTLTTEIRVHSIMLRYNRFRYISIHYYIVQTISQSIQLLPLYGLTALRVFLYPTLLIYSYIYFLCTILSIVVAPYIYY